MKNSFDWGDDIIDSRDIISRHEELTDELDGLKEAITDVKKDLEAAKVEDDEDLVEELEDDLESAETDLSTFLDDYFTETEMKILAEVIEEGESSPDWSHGEGLIHERYFTEYTEQLVDDCWEMPKEFKSGDWPWNHMTMDWEAAAEQLKDDYREFTVAGETYYIRA
jgi:hypothetical protein